MKQQWDDTIRYDILCCPHREICLGLKNCAHITSQHLIRSDNLIWCLRNFLFFTLPFSCFYPVLDTSSSFNLEPVTNVLFVLQNDIKNRRFRHFSATNSEM